MIEFEEMIGYECSLGQLHSLNRLEFWLVVSPNEGGESKAAIINPSTHPHTHRHTVHEESTSHRCFLDVTHTHLSVCRGMLMNGGHPV